METLDAENWEPLATAGKALRLGKRSTGSSWWVLGWQSEGESQAAQEGIPLNIISPSLS